LKRIITRKEIWPKTKKKRKEKEKEFRVVEKRHGNLRLIPGLERVRVFLSSVL